MLLCSLDASNTTAAAMQVWDVHEGGGQPVLSQPAAHVLQPVIVAAG